MRNYSPLSKNLLRLVPVLFIGATAVTSCNKGSEPAPATQMIESRTYEGDVLQTRTTFTYNDKGQISASEVHNYTAGVETGTFAVAYNYASDGRLLSALSPVNETRLAYDGGLRYNGCHTVWSDSSARPNYKAQYVYSATNSERVDSLIIRKTAAGKAPIFSRMKYSYGTDGTQTKIETADLSAVGTIKRSADGKRIEGIALNEGGEESFMALVYSDELASKRWMEPYLEVQHVAGAQCPYISPNEKHEGKAAHILDAYSVPGSAYTVPATTYTQVPEGKLVKHTVKVGNKVYVYYCK